MQHRNNMGSDIVERPAKLSKQGTRTRAGGKRFLSRESLDGRTITAKIYDRLVDEIAVDLDGGADRLSAIQRKLIESFAGASIVLEHLNARIIAGAEINNALISAYAQITSAMVRLSAKLGTERRAKPVMSMDDFLRLRQQARAHAARGDPAMTPAAIAEIEP